MSLADAERELNNAALCSGSRYYDERDLKRAIQHQQKALRLMLQALKDQENRTTQEGMDNGSTI